MDKSSLRFPLEEATELDSDSTELRAMVFVVIDDRHAEMYAAGAVAVCSHGRICADLCALAGNAAAIAP